MELKLMLRMLVRRWLLIVIPPVVVAVMVVPQFLGGSATSGDYVTSFKYTAAQRLNLPERDGDYQDVWLASEFVVNAFTEWIRGSAFRAELETALGADSGVDLGRLGIATDNQRSVGVVQMSHPSATDLQAIVEAALTVLETRNQVYFPHLGGEAAQVTILDAPVITASAPSLPNRFAPLIQLGVALMGGLGLALLAEYFDQRLRYVDEVERLGVRVLANVPRH